MTYRSKVALISSLTLTVFNPVFVTPAIAQSAVEKRLIELQKQSDLLRLQTENLQREIKTITDSINIENGHLSDLSAPVSNLASVPAQEPASKNPRYKIAFGGQYRINSYYAKNDVGKNKRRASRVRLRQNFDVNFNEQLESHLQLELGHTTDNITTTSNSVRETNIDVRHAVIKYTFDNELELEAGIVPLNDKFGETLFSSNWDYNPVAFALSGPLGPGYFRGFVANLDEGQETIGDDFKHYQLDYGLQLPRDTTLNMSATLIRKTDLTSNAHSHLNVGMNVSHALSNGLWINGFIVGSFTDGELLRAGKNGKGVAAKLELKSDRGFSIMATHASGSSDKTGFIPVMALARTFGYWGYGGTLTVQGPTDTGIDGDAVNISNNGYGLTSVQAHYLNSITDKLDLTLAAGWYGNSKTPAGRGSFVGTDFLAMGTYRFDDVLALDFGVTYVHLGDAVSGYWQGLTAETGFNGLAGETRDKTVLFTRLQAEY
jgi:hypothetical protein